MPLLKFNKSKSKILAVPPHIRIGRSLMKLSAARRKAALQQEKKEQYTPPKSRVTITGRVPLNRSNNLRGMHNDSEHMKKIRAMRKIYNRAMPVLQCSTCAFSSNCPQFKAGYECAFLPYMNSHTINTEQDLIESMKNLCEASLSRVHRQAMMETLTGAMPSLETSEAFNIAFMQLNALHTKLAEADTATISLETDDDSVIGRLFGGIDNLVSHTANAQLNHIEVAPQLKALPEQAGAGNKVNTDLIKEHTRDLLEHLTGSRKHGTRIREAGSQPVVHVGNIKI